ncbi:MAG: PmoA family protein [Candidatus Cyclobacteriaceae bacterium M3_2C_046]
MRLNYLLFSILLVLGFKFAQGQELASFIVASGQWERQDTPVSASLEHVEFSPDQPLQLYELSRSSLQPVPFQIEPGQPYRIWWILSGATGKEQKRVYVLKQEEQEQPVQAEVTFVKDPRSLVLFKQGQPVVQYNHAITPPPPGVDEVYSRSGYIHPLYSPSGFELTTIHPADHIHHMGIWNPWTKTKFEGREVDFWNLNKGQGTVRFADYISHYEGPVFGGFKSLHEHVDLTAPTSTGSKVAINEVWDIRVYNAGKDYSIVDFYATLNCASDSTIVLEKYRYAGFGYRANQDWTNQNSEILTSEGKTRTDADATKARWCKVAGETGQGRSGIVFMSHPSNHTHPEAMRVWPVDANQGRGDVFFQFCPIRDNDWPLKAGQVYMLKYRMYVFDGDISPEQAENRWQDFAHPPRVTVDLPK